MLRYLAAVLVGYFVVAGLSLVTAAVCWAVFGAQGSFREGSTVASNSAAGLSCILGLASAFVAGWVTAAIGKHSRNMPVIYLASLLLVFGLSLAIVGDDQPRGTIPEGKTTADLTFFEAGQVNVTPVWYDYAIGVIGFVGVILGGTIRGPGPSLDPRRHGVPASRSRAG